MADDMQKRTDGNSAQEPQRTLGGIPVTRKFVLAIVVPIVAVILWLVYILNAFSW